MLFRLHCARLTYLEALVSLSDEYILYSSYPYILVSFRVFLVYK